MVVVEVGVVVVVEVGAVVVVEVGSVVVVEGGSVVVEVAVVVVEVGVVVVEVGSVVVVEVDGSAKTAVISTSSMDTTPLTTPTGRLPWNLTVVFGPM